MTLLWIVLAVVVIVGLVLVLRRRGRRPAAPAPKREAMPEILVTEVAPIPTILDAPPAHPFTVPVSATTAAPATESEAPRTAVVQCAQHL